MQPVFDHPPVSMQGTMELRECYSWLYRLAEQLNSAVVELDQNIAVQVASQITASSGSSPAAQIASTAQELRSLIIKNAHTVEHYRDEIYQEMRENYLAISDFGTMRSDITREIQDTATGTLNRFIQSEEYTDVTSSVDSLESAVNLLNGYRTESDSYIQSGLLYYDPITGLPAYGVAIGDNLQRVTDGSGAEVLVRENITCTITSGRISFGMGGQEVAYLSNSSLYITSAQILSTFSLGNLVATVRPTGIDWRWR